MFHSHEETILAVLPVPGPGPLAGKSTPMIVRVQRTGKILLGLAVLASIVYLSFRLDVPSSPPVSVASVTALPEFKTVASDDEIVTRSAPARVGRTTLGAGGTLAAALERLGVPAAERPEIIRAVGSHVDLRRLPSQTGVTAHGDERRYPRRIMVRAAADRIVRITGLDGGPELRSQLVELPVAVRIETAGGRVESSVAQARSASTRGPDLTRAFADIFQWDVDLLVDPRPGDEVRVVYEAEHLGDVPEDLPTFGGAPSAEGDFLRVGRVLAASYAGARVHSIGYWIEHDRLRGYFDDQGRPLRKAFLKSPLNYRRISSGFSHARRHPVTHRVTAHLGVDFAAAPGTPVVATADGRVKSAKWDGALGRAVRVSHGGSLVTVYGHLSRFARGIEAGTEVKQNEVIGYVGSSGRATGPHLHYTMLQGGRAIDPLAFRSPPADDLPAARRSLLLEAQRRWLPVMAGIDLEESEFDLADRFETVPTAIPGA
jgi:hypothetical protein